MEYGWKKAILVVSFGTRHIDTITKIIGAIEQEIKKSFPAYFIYRAFINKSVFILLYLGAAARNWNYWLHKRFRLKSYRVLLRQ